MGLACIGLTHCPKCGTPYDGMSFKCKYCEQEKQQKQQKILDILCDMNDYEIEAFKRLVKQEGHKIKKEKLKQQIEQLENQLKE